jgi:hypothetical protein
MAIIKRFGFGFFLSHLAAAMIVAPVAAPSSTRIATLSIYFAVVVVQSLLTKQRASTLYLLYLIGFSFSMYSSDIDNSLISSLSR